MPSYPVEVHGSPAQSTWSYPVILLKALCEIPLVGFAKDKLASMEQIKREGLVNVIDVSIIQTAECEEFYYTAKNLYDRNVSVTHRLRYGRVVLEAFPIHSSRWRIGNVALPNRFAGSVSDFNSWPCTRSRSDDHNMRPWFAIITRLLIPVCAVGTPRIFAMAWRSHGASNNDLVAKLKGV